jgi:hypothetical protein
MRLIPTTPPVTQRHQPTPAPTAPRRRAQPCQIPAPRTREQHHPVPLGLHEAPGEKFGLVGFGAPVRRPWVVGEALAARTVLTASLAADHRVSDGRRGARFLVEIERLLQEPEGL